MHAGERDAAEFDVIVDTNLSGDNGIARIRSFAAIREETC